MLHQNDDSIAAYYNKLCGYWDELNLKDPQPQCSYEAKDKYATQIEQRRLMQF